jgi:hypothetical protein
LEAEAVTRSDFELVERLCNIADTITPTRTVQISDETLRRLREQVHSERFNLRNEDNLVGYEASCLIDCIAELAYARSDRDRGREERAIMYLNSFRSFMRGDLDKAMRAAGVTRR